MEACVCPMILITITCFYGIPGKFMFSWPLLFISIEVTVKVAPKAIENFVSVKLDTGVLISEFQCNVLFLTIKS